MASIKTGQAVSLNDVIIKINGKQIGYITKVDVNFNINENILYQAGDNGMPVDRVFLKREITGSFERTYVDNDVLNQLWDFKENKPVEFELVGQVQGVDSAGRDFVLSRCAIKGFPLSFDLDNETTQTFEFSALGFEFL